MPLKENAELDEVEPKKKKKKKIKGRNERFNDLQHLETVERHFGDDIKKCPCCSNENLTELAPEISYELDFKPAEFSKIKNIIHKIICKDCDVISRGDKPLSPLPKCMPTANLLSHIIHSRFDLYLPYYRLNRDFNTYGVDISIANLCNWTNATAYDIFLPLYNVLKENVLNTDTLYADETTMKEQAKGRCKTKYIWTYTNNISKNIIFDYATRGRENPSDFLKNYNGDYLITDKYAGYDEICRTKKIMRAYCWAHSRRKFHDIIKTTNDPGELKEVRLIHRAISKMLNADKKIRDGKRDDILEKREKEIRPMIDDIFKKLETLKSSIGLVENSIIKAINYMLGSCDEFKAFLNHIDIEPTNNISERNLRFLTLLRKNCLFVGNHRAGEATAIIISIIASARAHNLDIRKYLTHIIEHLPNAKMSEVKIFLPQNCYQFQNKQYV